MIKCRDVDPSGCTRPGGEINNKSPIYLLWNFIQKPHLAKLKG
jgi:hypothetical protein